MTDLVKTRSVAADVRDVAARSHNVKCNYWRGLHSFCGLRKPVAPTRRGARTKRSETLKRAALPKSLPLEETGRQRL